MNRGLRIIIIRVEMAFVIHDNWLGDDLTKLCPFVNIRLQHHI